MTATTALAHRHQSERQVRLDKNMAFNILEFRRFGDDAKLIKAVLMFMALNHQQEDLFGFYKLEPERFAELFGLNVNHLFRIHGAPFFKTHDENAHRLIALEKKHGRNSIHRTWSTELENALYILTHKSLYQNYRHHTEDKTIIESKSFVHLEEIRFEMVRTGKTKKVVYYYKPNPKFEKNLKNYFMLSVMEKVVKLKKPKLDDAYLDLLNRIANANQRKLYAITFNIDTLADILQIQPYKRFSSYKAKVEGKFNLLRSVIGDDVKGLRITWARSDGKAPAPGKKVNKTENLAIISWDKLTEGEINKKEGEVFKNVFNTELNRALIQAFFNTYEGKLISYGEDEKKKAFYDWMLSDQDMDIKEIKYQDTYVDVYKTTRSLVRHKENFVRVLGRISKFNQENGAISFENDMICLVHSNRKGETKKYLFRHFHQLYGLWDKG